MSFSYNIFCSADNYYIYINKEVSPILISICWQIKKTFRETTYGGRPAFSIHFEKFALQMSIKKYLPNIGTYAPPKLNSKSIADLEKVSFESSHCYCIYQ